MIKQRNGIAVLEHYREDNGLPEHSPRPLELDALEVYDAPSEWCAMGRAYPGLVADMLATTHSSSLLLAANAHVGNFPGAVMVEATDFDSQSIARAVRAGRFYATQGPEIHIRQVSDEKIKVYCSPSERIAFLSNTERTGGREFCGHGLIEAECLVDREDTFIRAEVTDADGRKAFSNMIVLK